MRRSAYRKKHFVLVAKRHALDQSQKRTATLLSVTEKSTCFEFFTVDNQELAVLFYSVKCGAYSQFLTVNMKYLIFV